jgi:predicted aspartyl protease
MSLSKRPRASINVSFRIGRSDPLIVVQGTANGAGPFNFVVDTGASMSVLTPGAARRAGVSGGRRARASGAQGSMGATICRVRSLRVGDVEARNLQVAVVDLASLNRQTRLKIGGIIGHNFLRRYLITIDYPKRRIGFRKVLAS